MFNQVIPDMRYILIMLALIILNTLTYGQGAYLQVKRITSIVDAYPVLSPDGKSVLFISNRTGVFHMYTMNPDGTNQKQLTTGTVDYVTPVWSPDGKKIAFASGRYDESDICIMNSDGTNERRLTTTPGDDSHPKFSPDGSKIVYCSAQSTPDLKADWSKQHIEIYTMNLDGSDIKKITNFKTTTTYPSISPDGTKIAYRKIIDAPGFNWDLSTTKRNSEVFVMNIDGTGERNLSDNTAYDGWPAWTPEGNVIFSSNRGGVPFKGQLYSVKPDGTVFKQLTDIQHSFVQHSISVDGKFIFCQDNTETNEYEFGGVALLPFKP